MTSLILSSAAKPSRPSRAYLHLTHPQYLGPLADHIRAASFVDARGSSSDSVLLGPPILVFAPFSKIPGKARTDGRQGTIDQDPEFIDFLTSLTNPVIKSATIVLTTDKEAKLADAKIITPLVQYIKDKKANKFKDGKSPKHVRQESKDNKVDERKPAVKNGKSKVAVVVEKKSLVKKVEKLIPDVVAAPKIVQNPQEASHIDCTSPASSAAQATTQLSTLPPPKLERRRERGSASIAAKMLRRDLAIASGTSSRRIQDNIFSANKMEIQKPIGPVESVLPVSATISTPPTFTAAVSMPAEIPSGPAATRTVQQPQATPVQQSIPTPLPTSAVPNFTTTHAFLKHANPSQGVTEPLLEEAFKAFGAVIKVEIDKKKGFAYVDFAEASSLQKAIASSPVKVAQGQVVVLERKTGSILQNRNARGQQSQANTGTIQNRGARGGGRGRSVRGGSTGATKISNTTSSANVSASISVHAPT